MTTIDIHAFCAPGDIREYLHKPFNDSGWTAATNGHALVAVPEIKEFAGNKGPKKGLGEILDFDSTPAWRPMPDLEIPDGAGLKACVCCDGSGLVAKCPECLGDGEIEFENRYSTYVVDCDTCSGRGETKRGADIECDECNGTGKDVDIYDNIELLGVKFQPRYVRLINGHPGIEVALSPKQGMIVFRQVIDGQEVARGAIMGLNI